MAETTTEVRADIEQTRTRLSGAIAELGEKVDVAQKVRDHPWAAVGVAFGAGFALSASRADVKAARVTADATKGTGGKLGLALDGGAVPFFLLGQLRFAAEKLPAVRLRSGIDAVFRTDLALKSSGGDPRTLLERLVVELCEAPRKGASYGRH